MRILKGFILKQVGNCYAVIAVGENAKRFNIVITLNYSGQLLWNKVSEGCDEQDLVDVLMNEYEVDVETAKKDVQKFCDTLVKLNVLEK